MIRTSKVTKTQDNRTVLYRTGNNGLEIFYKSYLIGIETGLFFGKKNTYIENQNIVISGNCQKEEQVDKVGNK